MDATTSPPIADNSPSTDSAPRTTLSRVTDYAMAAIIFLAPLVMAGRYATGRFVLLLLIAVAASSWCLDRALTAKRSTWIWSHAEWLAATALVLVLLQLTPLSSSWMSRLAPHTAEDLPLWSQAGAELTWPRWNRISFAPEATRGGLAMLWGYALLFFVMLQRIGKQQEIEVMLKAVALAGVGMASLGLAQYLFGNGKFLWFHEHPSRDTLAAVKGTFANENHFAHFLALTVGPLLWWLVQTQQREQEHGGFHFGPVKQRFSNLQVALAVGLGIVFLATLLTYSRGGIVMVMLATVVTTALLVAFRQVGRRWIITVGSVVFVCTVAIWIHGQDLLVREVESLRSASIDALDQDSGRRKIWRAVTDAIPHYALLGTGIGTHRDVYPKYFDAESSVVYTHAESGFLQVLLEAGGPGLALLLCGIALSGYWLASTALAERDEFRPLVIPIVAAWTVSLAHAIADFNWYIPANMTVTLILLALAARLCLLSSSRPRIIRIRLPRVAWMAATVVVLICSCCMVGHYVGPARASKPMDEYLAWSLASNRFSRRSLGPGRQRSLGLVDGRSLDSVSWMAHQLGLALRHDPYDGRAHVRMAALCLRLFELQQQRSDNAMSLAQIRDAALSSQFASRQEMSDWVTRAVGSNRELLDQALRHAKQGVMLTPLEGRGYLYLGEVAFLDDQPRASGLELLTQAYAARPYDPSVQFMYGRHRLLAGDEEAALALWKQAFRKGSSVRRRIIAAVGLQATPQEIIDVFQPDMDGLRDMFEFYRRGGQEPQLQFVGQRYVETLEKQARMLSGESAGDLWYDAQFAHSALGNAEAAAEAAVHCVVAQPNQYKNRFACALRLREAGRPEEALREFRWCQLRRPEDADLNAVVSTLQRELRARQASTAPADRQPPLR